MVFVREYDDMSAYVVGTQQDNELIISDVLDTIHECFDTVFPRGICRSQLTSNMYQVILILDEIIDDGVIMTTELETILARIGETRGRSSRIQDSPEPESSAPSQPPAEAAAGGGGMFASVFASAKNSLAKTLAL